MTEEKTTNSTTEALGERPDPAGIVRRGEEAAERVHYYAERSGEPPTCQVGMWGGDGGKFAPDACERGAVMEVYGLPMCAIHGEEAASSALEEMDYELEQEIRRPINQGVRPLSPHVKEALEGAAGMFAVRLDYERGDALLLEAFPLDRERVAVETLAYHEDPDDPENRDYFPPFDAFMEDRMLLHRFMRLAFEEGATWLVEALEKKRADVAAQAAYALALDNEAGRR